MLRLVFIFLVLAGLLAACGSSTSQPEPVQPINVPETGKQAPLTTPTSAPTPKPIAPQDEFAFAQKDRLGRGVNLGNALEAPVEGEWGMVLEEEFFRLIAEAGFDSVRVPVRWSAHAAEDAPYTIAPDFFERIDWVLEQAEQNDLAVVLNMHHYEEIFENPVFHKDRFMAIWKQIAERYRDAPDSVLFEPLNEPNGTLANTSWNDFAKEVIAVIRQTNPKRTIVIGPGDWNSVNGLPGLFLPEEDRNIIVTVHYYLPFQFTHQGAEWADGSEAWMGTTWTATEDQKKMIDLDMGKVLRWSNQYGRPIFLGEFGAYSKADMDSRALWTEYVARSAEKNGFSWAYWEFGAGFGVYDRTAKAWVEPIRQALLP